jgi:hypothetical protein
MIGFSPLSTKPAFSPAVPIAVWCRAPALLVLQGRSEAQVTWQVGPPLARRTRRAARTVAMQGCLLASRVLLTAASVLVRTGRARPSAAALALRWSSRLTRTAMRLWRGGRLRTGL